jgi:hypothetical protein
MMDDNVNADLAHLNFTELLEERLTVRTRIREIVAERAVTGRPNDHQYRRWLSGINHEQSILAGRFDRIKLELAKRQAAAQKGPKLPLLPPEQQADLEARRVRLRDAIAEGGPDALLIGMRRIFTRLWEGVSAEEIGLSAEERETLGAVSLYLRQRYGSAPVKEATHE